MSGSTFRGTILVCLLLSMAASASAQASVNGATFVRMDASTKGNWPSNYGADGYVLSTGAQRLPADVSAFSVQNSNSWVWAYNTSDPRVLRTPGGGPANATTWYNAPNFYFDVTVASGYSEQVALYGVDWDFGGRTETVQVVDGDTNAQLDQQVLSNFTGGIYLVWNISGHVKINVKVTNGPNAVISGVFFGGNGSNTIRVPGDQPTIQAAINAASNGQTVLVAPGTYTENINFNGKAITATSSGGPSVTTIDGGSNGTVVTFVSGEGPGSVLNGFTIQRGLNGYAAGGIQVTAASPTITGNVITQNRAPVGLGIYVNGGSPLIQGNVITGNNVQAGDGGQGGGGILVSGSSTASSSPQILGNTITNNGVASGGQGGGISVGYFSNPTIQGNLIANNTAYNNGGGIAVQDYNGAGIIQNVIVNNSSVDGSGGGLYVATTSGAVVRVENNTIASNSASDLTSGIDASGYSQEFTFTNNIIVAPVNQQAVTCDGTYTTTSPFFSYNDAYSGGSQAWWGTCDHTTNPGNISADPLFVNPPVSNFHLQPGSPAIDAGNNSALDLPSKDFDGNTRIFNGVVDLGAYEYQGLTTASFSTGGLSFPGVTVGGASQPMTFTLNNTGATALQVSSITATAGFSETDTCQNSNGIAAGQSCQISVVFAPTTQGPQGGTVKVAANVGGSPLMLPLSGTGATNSSASTASLTGTDTGTRGNWQSNYGAEGYYIANGPQVSPLYDPSFAVQNQLNWTWVPSTSDPRALLVPGAPGSLAATWYSGSSFDFDVNLTDGESHQVALYLLDWDAQGRSETVSVVDAVSNNPLASTSVSNFSNGVYLIWTLSGHVKINVTLTGGPNAVVSGVFFGGAMASMTPGPSLSITKTQAGHVVQGQLGVIYTLTVANAQNAGATSGLVTVTESLPSGLTLVSMAGTGWTCPANTATCTRSEQLGAGSTYPPITVTVNVAANASSPQVNQASVSGGGSPSATSSVSTVIGATNAVVTAATFIGQDTKTQGAWQGVYGSDGFYLANSAQSPALYDPGFAIVSNSNWTWAASTADPRSLQVPNTPAGIAAAWYAYGFAFEVNFTDGQAHYVAVYALDWDNQGRSESVRVLDASSNNVLDQETVSNFGGGAYLVWKVSGNVIIQVTSLTGPNAVISGIFFGAPHVTYTFSGSNTGPGGDGLPVAFQYASQGFIPSQVSLLSSQSVSCTNCLISTVVPAVVFQPSNGGADQIDFSDVDLNGTVFSFPLGAFSVPGTYASSPPYYPGTLTVSLGKP